LLKILQICNKAPFPPNDGSSIAIYNMAKGLMGNGVDLNLLTINTKKHFKPDEDVPEDFRKLTKYESVYKNTSTSAFGAFLNLFSTTSYFVSRFNIRSFRKKLIAVLKSQRFDIVQLEGLFMGVYIDAIRKHTDAKIVLRAHNIEHLIWRRHIANVRPSLKRSYLSLQNSRLKRYEHSVWMKVDAIVPISVTDEKQFRALGYNKPLCTVITGVDVRTYQNKPDLSEKPNTVFYFGSMDWLPNQEAARWFLNNCWEKVHASVPAARFIIAGRGMPLEFFHITRPNVQIVENVEDSKGFFHQHQIMLVPLRSGSGVRIKIIEGMAYGKAIVSTTIGAEGINYTDGKNILIADDSDDFASKVINLLKDPAKRKELEKNAAEVGRTEFDNGKIAAKLVAFYEELLNA
jgi:glycosyltransferase involved in cell wall biosynthesis